MTGAGLQIAVRLAVAKLFHITQDGAFALKRRQACLAELRFPNLQQSEMGPQASNMLFASLNVIATHAFLAESNRPVEPATPNLPA